MEYYDIALPATIRFQVQAESAEDARTLAYYLAKQKAYLTREVDSLYIAAAPPADLGRADLTITATAERDRY